MPRRGGVKPREIPPDPKYQNVNVARVINRVMLRGQKATAERIVYDAMSIISERKREPVGVVEQAIQNATPLLEVKPRRVGGATYQIPIQVRPSRSMSLALRWLTAAARARKGRPMAERLANELMEAAQGQGAAVKRREDTHRMAEANKAFVHYRW
ncbi:MAG: 30S ribosomal protein S7 [Dehalococcoidia bacterium]